MFLVFSVKGISFQRCSMVFCSKDFFQRLFVKGIFAGFIVSRCFSVLS